MSLIQSADIWQNYTVKFPHSVEELMEAEFPAKNKLSMQRKRCDGCNWSVNAISWNAPKRWAQRKVACLPWKLVITMLTTVTRKESTITMWFFLSWKPSFKLNLRHTVQGFKENLFLFCLLILDPTTGPHHYKEASTDNLTKDITD